MTVDYSKREQFEAAVRERRSGGIAPGGSGPHDPGMETRVATLEADLKDVKGSLNRIETTLAVVAETVKHLATKADLADAGAETKALATKLDGVTARLDTVERTVASKVLGPWQLPAILGSCVGVIVAGAAGIGWLLNHGIIPH